MLASGLQPADQTAVLVSAVWANLVEPRERTDTGRLYTSPLFTCKFKAPPADCLL